MRRARLFPARMRPRRRLARRAGAAGPAFRPIVLGWRKPARVRFGVPARPGRLAVRQSWSPRFHLHFDIRSTGIYRAAPGGAVPGKPATTILWRRIDARLAAHFDIRSTGGLPAAAPGKAVPGRPATTILWRRIDARPTAPRPVLRTSSTREWRSIAHRVERAVPARWRGRRETRWSEIVRMFRTTAMPPGPIGRPAPGASAAATIVHRGPVVVAPPARRAAPLRLEPRLPRPARRGAASPVGGAARPAAAPGAPIRPLGLVWRSESGERPAETTEGAVRAAMASVSPLPAAAATAPSWPPPEAIEALRPRLIDGALIDRLAEDVIGRVEKKIRIERERRGV